MLLKPEYSKKIKNYHGDLISAGTELHSGTMEQSRAVAACEDMLDGLALTPANIRLGDGDNGSRVSTKRGQKTQAFPACRVMYPQGDETLEI